MPTAQLNGVELYYERRGRGAPLLMMVGMAGHHRYWGEHFLELLDRHRELILYDHRGIGKSGEVTAPFAMRDLAADAAGLLAHLGLPTSDVLGASMGGMVAQELALGYPHRVRRLVLGGTEGGGSGSNVTAAHRWQPIVDALGAEARLEAKRHGWGAIVSEAFAAKDTPFERMKVAAEELPVPQETIFQQLQAINEHDRLDGLGGVRAPALVLHGTEDQVIPHANGRQLAGRLPRARFEALEGTAHMWWWEAPERAAELINAFLEEEER